MKIVQKVEENAAAAAAFAVQDEDAEEDHDAEPGGQEDKGIGRRKK